MLSITQTLENGFSFSIYRIDDDSIVFPVELIKSLMILITDFWKWLVDDFMPLKSKTKSLKNQKQKKNHHLVVLEQDVYIPKKILAE